MSLNLNDRPASGLSAYSSSQAFTDAVNDSRFVRTFGAVALVGSTVILISGAVAIGIGLAVAGFGSSRYYRVLGLVVAILGGAGFLLGPFAPLGGVVLSAGIVSKGADVLGTLASEGQGDPDWQSTRTRTLIGMVLSSIGFFISGLWLILSLAAFLRIVRS